MCSEVGSIGSPDQPRADLLLCSDGQESGSTLPPWRNTAALLSKWLPRRSVDKEWPASNDVPLTSAAPEQPPAVLPLAPYKPPPKPSPSSAHHSRSVSDVVEDTNSPRPSKTQRLKGSAAAAAAAHQLLTGFGDSPLRPRPARQLTLDTSPPARRLFCADGCPAPGFAVEANIPGLLRPLHRVSFRGAAQPLAMECAAEAFPPRSPAAVATGNGGIWKESSSALQEGAPERSISVDRCSENSEGSTMCAVPITCIG